VPRFIAMPAAIGYHPDMALEENLSASPSSSRERNVWLTIPNTLTLLRLIAIIPFAYLVTVGKDQQALILFILAGLTDTIDGTIARRFGQTSTVGRFIDPLADKLFTGVAYIVLSAFRSGLSSIPTWVMVAVLARDVLILVGSLVVYRTSSNAGFKPSVYGKLNTFIEIGVVVCFLAMGKLAFIVPLLPFFYILLLASLLVSTADYFRTGVRMMRAPASGDKSGH
jgi:cardiolipin synthase